jgi:uncharacterized membrane protein YuzA (DUF378 family)
MRIVSLVSFFLMVIGAVNWLLVGVSRFDLVRWALGRRSLLGRIVYSLVGVAGVTQLSTYIWNTVRGKKKPSAVAV